MQLDGFVHESGGTELFGIGRANESDSKVSENCGVHATYLMPCLCILHFNDVFCISGMCQKYFFFRNLRCSALS